MEGMGEEKLYFLLMKLVKRKRAQFWAKCQLILSPILAPCYGTHVGANERNLLWDSWYSPDEGLGTSSKLKRATSLRSRSKQKKLILLMMMMLEDDSSVSKKVARKTWDRLWLLRRQEKGAFYPIFRELSVEDLDGFCEYMRMPYAKFELNFYTFNRRHVEFWARVKGSKAIVD